MGLRADRKKAKGKYKVGDHVTWRDGSVISEVIEITDEGVFVKDETTQRYFVPFIRNPKNKHENTIAPLRKVQ